MRRTVVLVLLGVALVGCSAPSAAAPPTPTTVTPPSAEPQARVLPIYYVAATAAGPRLQREFHRVTTTDPASAAVREMLQVAAVDPDYRTYWPAGTALRSPVTVGPDAITVDLTTAATGAPAGTMAPEMSLQQLVFTVQGASGSNLPVRVLVGGAPGERVLGGVPVSAPVPRGDVYALRSLVQIDSPAYGAVTPRDVVVTGEAAVFEATVHWHNQ